ncbi:MAG: carboxypeptidase regulatory-like domain-containing protein, partial [Magnetococcales bacterium]|nr:carboxypeptidase regulatory-like domain-containing protein [Magnetococcales bacterium]
SAQLTVAPMNLVVGGSRDVMIENFTGTPTLTATPEGVVTLTSFAGGTSVSCDAPGSALITVTDGTETTASATIHCVAVAETAIGEVNSIADWIFPANVTLVTQNFWHGNETGSWGHYAYRWSRAGGTETFQDRGTLSTVVGDDGHYYTLNGDGLTFHGNKQFNATKGDLTRTVRYGFVTPPDLESGVSGIDSALLASSNWILPTSLIPATLVEGATSSVTQVEFDLDVNELPDASKWVVTKHNVSISGILNLLSTELPEELKEDLIFQKWRDAITDTELLGKLTKVIRIQMEEIRYKAGQSDPVTERGTLYLVKGLGIVYEQWHESEGVSKSALMAKDSGTGLVSLTSHAIAAKKFRIDAPAGVVLNKPFVHLRVEHTQGENASSPHAHELVGSVNETSGGNSALFTVYRSNDSTGDNADVVKLRYGAKDFETQMMLDVDTASMASPMVLTLTEAQKGRLVTFTAKDRDGASITNAGITVYPDRDGVCALDLGAFYELTSSGTASITLADGQHCVSLWPQSSSAFVGGWYDPSVASGLANIVAPTGTTNGVPVTISAATTSVALVVGRDDGPDHSRVTGLLTDGSQGISNAEILAYPDGGGTPQLFHTDATGAFTMDLPVGQYIFMFRYVANGVLTQGYLTAIGETNTLSATQGVTQNIAYDILMGQVKLTSAYRVNTVALSGVITDSTTGHITTPVTVTVRSTTAGGFFAKISADSTGAFSVPVVPSQDYYVEFSAQGSGKLYRGYLDGTLAISASKANLSAITPYENMTLNGALTDAMGVATYPISGTVTDNATTPAGIVNATVKVVNQADTSLVYETNTDAQGAFSLSVAAGSYKIELFANGYIGGMAKGTGSTIVLGGEVAAQVYLLGGTAGVSALSLSPKLVKETNTGGLDPGISKITVTGYVTGSQGALKNILVEFQPDWTQNTTFVEMASVKTDATGNYSVSIYPGYYRVMFRAEYWDATTSKMVIVPGVLGQGGFSDGIGNVIEDEGAANLFQFVGNNSVNALLSSGVQVTGTVTSKTGAAFKDVKVEFQPVYDDHTEAAPWVETTTDATGTFSAFVKPGAIYRVYFNTNYWDWQNQKQVQLVAVGGFSEGSGDNGVNGDEAAAKKYTFTSNDTLNAVLTTGLTVQGVVTKDGITGVAEVVVRIQPEWDPATGRSGTWGETKTDTNGHYSFSVQPGLYRIEFLTTGLTDNVIGGFADGKGGLNNDWASANLFQINDDKEVNAQLIAGVTLTGTVALSDGTLITGADLFVHSLDWTSFFNAKSDDQGAFSIRMKPGLEYQVEVWPGSGSVPFLGGNWVTMTQVDGGLLTALKMDHDLNITISVDSGVSVNGRVVDENGWGVSHAWVTSDFGNGSTDADGNFKFNLPSAVAATQVRPSFSIHVSPGGYEDANHAWVQGGLFVGGVVTLDAASGLYQLSADEQKAVAFASNLEGWPTSDLENGLTGLVVHVGKGTVIAGKVTNGSDGVGNLWVNAWSHEVSSGAGVATGGNGDYSILVPTPAAGTTVWYEVNLWSDQYLAPDAVLVKVQSQGVVGVYAIDKEKSINGETGLYNPVSGETLLADPNGNVPVNFTVSTGNTISGRVTDSSNNGLAWTWVDIHSKDGSKWYGANTDENGYYKVKVNPADNYLGVVWGWGGQYRTTYYKNAGKEEDATQIDASGVKNPENIDFMLSSGAKISGTIAGLSKDTKVWLSVWSESEHVWGGAEVTGTTADTVNFEITGLAQASDYRLDWRSDSLEVPAGFYGGANLGPKNWE